MSGVVFLISLLLVVVVAGVVFVDVSSGSLVPVVDDSGGRCLNVAWTFYGVNAVGCWQRFEERGDVSEEVCVSWEERFDRALEECESKRLGLLK